MAGRVRRSSASWKNSERLLRKDSKTADSARKVSRPEVLAEVGNVNTKRKTRHSSIKGSVKNISTEEVISAVTIDDNDKDTVCNDTSDEEEKKIQLEDTGLRIQQEDTGLRVQQKNTRPNKDTGLRIHRKGARLKMQQEHAEPKVQQKDTMLEIQQEDTGLRTRRKSTRLKVQQEDMELSVPGPRVQQEDTGPRVQQKDMGLRVQQKDKGLRVQQKDMGLRVQQKDTGLRVQQKDTGLRVQQEDMRLRVQQKSLDRHKDITKETDKRRNVNSKWHHKVNQGSLTWRVERADSEKPDSSGETESDIESGAESDPKSDELGQSEKRMKVGSRIESNSSDDEDTSISIGSVNNNSLLTDASISVGSVNNSLLTAIEEGKIQSMNEADDLGGSIPLGREEQMKRIRLLMGKPSDHVPPSLLIFGEEGVGKTYTVKYLFSTMKVPHALVSMKECYSTRILFECILNSLSGVHPASSNHYRGYTRCDNLPQFLKDIKDLVRDNEWEGQTIYIVLDDFEMALKTLQPTTLTSLVCLAELTGMNLCVVMVSRCSWEQFSIPWSTTVIPFPQYTKKEAIEILSLDCPPICTEQFYRTSVQQIYSILHPITRNIKELKYMCSQGFPIHCKPVVNGKSSTQVSSEIDSLMLWKHLKSFCQNHLTQAYTRTNHGIVNSTAAAVHPPHPVDNGAASSHNKMSAQSNLGYCFKRMPLYTKYLLIASYLSSYNPTKFDQRFFSEKRSKKRRTTANRNRENELKRQLIGPRPFPLDRMLMIFHSITSGEKIKVTPTLLSQVPNLVTLGLLVKISSTDALDVIKYKCMISFEDIRELSENVGFEIVRYLADYN